MHAAYFFEILFVKSTEENNYLNFHLILWRHLMQLIQDNGLSAVTQCNVEQTFPHYKTLSLTFRCVKAYIKTNVALGWDALLHCIQELRVSNIEQERLRFILILSATSYLRN